MSTLVEDSPEEALARLEGFLDDGFVPAPLLATLATGGGSGAGEPAS